MLSRPHALFLDRDGTVIADRHYLRDPAGVELLPGVGEALARFQAAGTHLFLVSNQSGIGRGYLTPDDLAACQRRLAELLLPYNVCFDDARFCPHAPEEGCRCRKPGIALWESLRDAHNLDPRQCVMVGDKREDVLFGVNAGFAASFAVLTGKMAARAAEFNLPPSGLLLPPTPAPCATTTGLVRDLGALANALT